MSDPNSKTKLQQAGLMVGAAVVILLFVMGGMFLFDQAPPSSREKLKTVSLTPPGTIEDKDAWRATEAAKGQSNETLYKESLSKQRKQEDDLKALKKEIDALKQGKGSQTDAASATAQAAHSASGVEPAKARYMTAEQAAAKVLETPLPNTSPGGQRVLGSPTGAGSTARPGQPPAPVGKLNQPIQQIEVKPEPVELISFGSVRERSAQGGAGQSGNPEVVGFPVDERATKVQTPKGKSDAKQSVEFIPAGSFVRVAMLNGVDAPTGGQAQSNPLPIAFQVLDLANLANRYRLDIKDCRFIAAAFGDISSERTMARTESLTCVINGETVEMQVKGQVIGEDGKAGIRGRLVTKQGQLLANALFAGSLSGIGRAFQAAATTTTSGGGGLTQSIDPDKVTQAGIGGGVGSAANMMAQYYLKAADKLFPVIETDGGRVVEILITKGAVYQGTAAGKATYRGLLKRAGNQSRSNDDD